METYEFIKQTTKNGKTIRMHKDNNGYAVIIIDNDNHIANVTTELTKEEADVLYNKNVFVHSMDKGAEDFE